MKTVTGIIVGLIVMGFFWVTDTHKETRHLDSGEPPELFANQMRDDLRTIFADAIGRAQESVNVIIYSLTDDVIIKALNQKAAEGVPVRVVCDAKASPYIDKKLKPPIQVMRRFGDGLMHLKILTIDNNEVWIGSANLSSESLRMHGNLVAAVASPPLAEMIKDKLDGMTEYGRAGAVPHRDFTLGGQQVEMWFLPDNTHATQKIKELVKGAKKTIRVAMFTWTREDMAKAMIDAKKRGIDVRVAMDRSSTQGASKKIADMLQKGGVPVFMNKGAALLHHKFMYIDGATLVNGSANWTKAAFTQNDDCFMILNGMTDKQTSYMDALWDEIEKESSQ